MTTYTIDLNSFQVEANNEEEAIDKAEKMLRDDISLAFPLEAIEDQ